MYRTIDTNKIYTSPDNGVYARYKFAELDTVEIGNTGISQTTYVIQGEVVSDYDGKVLGSRIYGHHEGEGMSQIEAQSLMFRFVENGVPTE